jgi:CHAT domain-containing protein
MVANQKLGALLTGIAGRLAMPMVLPCLISWSLGAGVVFAQASPAQSDGGNAVMAIACQEGRFPEAVALLARQVESAGSGPRRHAQRLALADAHASWAKCLGSSYEHQKAIEHYRAAYEIDKELRQAAAGADLRNIGKVYSNIGENQKALGYFERALPLHRAVGDRQGEAATLSHIGEVYQDLDQKQKALGYLEQALPLQRAVGDRTGEAETLDDLGEVYDDLDEKQKALGYYEQALALQQAVGDRKGEATTLYGIGDVYDDLDDKRKALEYFERALPIQREVGDRKGEAETLDGFGVVYDERGEEQKALGYYEQALPIRQAVGDRAGEAVTLSHIGDLYANLGDEQKALRYYEQALPIHRAVGDRFDEAVTLRSIGRVYAAPGDKQDKQKALGYYEQALSTQQAVGDRSGEAETLDSIGQAYDKLGDRQKALDCLGQALAIDRELVDRWREAVTLGHIGKVYSNLGERQQALEHYEQALPLHQAVGDRSGEAKTNENLMREWNALSKPRLAIFYGKQAVNLYQQLRANIRGLPRELQHGYLKTVGGAYRSLADILIAQGRLSEAQEVLGLLKQEEYLEFVRRDPSEAPSRDSRSNSAPIEAEWHRRYAAIADQVVELGRRRGELERKSVRTAEEDAELARLDADLEVAGKAYQGFLAELAKELGTNDSRVYQVKEAQGLMEVVRELGAGTVVLYTLVGEKSLRIILITPEVEKAGEYPIAKAELTRKVRAFHEALRHPRQDPRPLAQELYRIVVGPIAKDLEQAGAQTLMWSLDGVLRYLPIAALHDGKTYLLERYRSVVFTPASNAHLKDQPTARWRGVGLGVSRAIGVFRALPGVPFELRGIFRDERSSAGVIPGTVLLDEAFTIEAMKTAIRQGVSLVHVASHFHFVPGNETESFLLLGDRDKTKNHLTLGQVRASANLFGGVELLTLSACETAVGGEADGAEVEGFAVEADGAEVEGFAVLAQRQGAKSVLATLWPVDDESTSLLMREFYKLREAPPGTAKAEALRQAQLALLHGRIRLTSDEAAERGLDLPNARSAKPGSRLPRFTRDPEAPYAHPYFWAPFILIGNWR